MDLITKERDIFVFIANWIFIPNFNGIVQVKVFINFADGDSDLLYDDGTDWPGCIHKKDYRNPLHPWGTKLYAFA